MKGDYGPGFQNSIQNVPGPKVSEPVSLPRVHLPSARTRGKVERSRRKIVTRYPSPLAHSPSLLLRCRDSVPRIDAMYTSFISLPSRGTHLRSLPRPTMGTDREKTMATVYPLQTGTKIPTSGRSQTGTRQTVVMAARSKLPKVNLKPVTPGNSAAAQLK